MIVSVIFGLCPILLTGILKPLSLIYFYIGEFYTRIRCLSFLLCGIGGFFFT